MNQNESFPARLAGQNRRDFIRLSAVGAAGLALSRPLTVSAVDAAAPQPAMHAPPDESAVLAERAKDYLRQIQEVMRGPGGLIISHSRFDTRRPLQEGEELSPYLHQVLDSVWGPEAPKPTVAEWYYGENTAWATGWLLWSQMIRYRVTGEEEAMTIARKCFRDLNHLFALSRPFEPGLLGKPHGGRGGQTTSYDQSANPVLLYAEFARDFGTAEEKGQARRNLLDHGDYYLRRNWVMNHHGNLARIVDPAHTSAMKYLACMHAAFDATGEVRFRDNAVKYVRQIAGAGLLPWPAQNYELNANLMYYSWLGEYWSKTSVADAADWIGNIGVYWEAAQRGLDQEGLLLDGIYDTRNKKFTPTKEGWMETNPPSAGGKPSTLRWWRSPTGYQGRTLYTLTIAILGMLAQKHGRDPHAHEISRKILLRVDGSGLRQCWDDGRLPPEMQPFANLFGAEFPAQWLVAYWMGREQRSW
ncbi:MAG: hypothetical protein JWM88_896 [Verrucomicrobia bacterium]|nr:hypothetical protein [Verrucomicrobiota bacterium]